ncbi:ProQ/FINO family protein [Sinorhizobium arboris]|uniref:ProQ/FINO family protein n=1 Tax=Sinorhizobium arboris TaxID=76745 RepID=UPI0004899D09
MRDRESELSDEELKRARRAYTKIDKNLAAMRVGAVRVDLDGEPYERLRKQPARRTYCDRGRPQKRLIGCQIRAPRAKVGLDRN